jgi:hypothetical protein
LHPRFGGCHRRRRAFKLERVRARTLRRLKSPCL